MGHSRIKLTLLLDANSTYLIKHNFFNTSLWRLLSDVYFLFCAFSKYIIMEGLIKELAFIEIISGWSMFSRIYTQMIMWKLLCLMIVVSILDIWNTEKCFAVRSCILCSLQKPYFNHYLSSIYSVLEICST